MNTGFLQLRHISHDGQTFATAIPRKEYVQVYVHKYQDILNTDPGNLPYVEYFDWLDRNDYVEECTGRHRMTIKQEYDQIPQSNSNGQEKLQEKEEIPAGQMDIFGLLES